MEEGHIPDTHTSMIGMCHQMEPNLGIEPSPIPYHGIVLPLNQVGIKLQLQGLQLTAQSKSLQHQWPQGFLDASPDSPE